ncbi:hypothetical protein [Rossellomorea marisflavi]|uniref:hypothetical protein n=1 Tax=Rossellomorea marisflavi TaxID=189381 RepID=UPI0011538236|nr:hypothetical protein [Rossellomorea marisflavi]
MVRSFPLRSTAFLGACGEPLRLRLQGLTCPLFPKESADLRCNPLYSSFYLIHSNSLIKLPYK